MSNSPKTPLLDIPLNSLNNNNQNQKPTPPKRTEQPNKKSFAIIDSGWPPSCLQFLIDDLKKRGFEQFKLGSEYNNNIPGGVLSKFKNEFQPEKNSEKEPTIKPLDQQEQEIVDFNYILSTIKTMRHRGCKKPDFQKWDAENIKNRNQYLNTYFLYAGFPCFSDLSRCPEPPNMKNIFSHILHIKGNVKSAVTTPINIPENIHLLWGRVAPKQSYYSLLNQNQKLNCFPGMADLCRKDLLTKNLNKLINEFGLQIAPFWPLTFNLPEQLPALKNYFETSLEKEIPFILKPSFAARGNGIRLITKFEDIETKSEFIQKDKVIAQKYLINPLTVQGYKITFRIYVTVTSWNPLRVYVHRKGLTSLSSSKYQKSIDSFKDKFVHLTNLDINHHLEGEFIKNFHPDCKHEGLRVDMQDFFRMLREKENVDTEKLIWEKIKDAIATSLFSVESLVSTLVSKLVKDPNNCFILLGYDFMCDDQYQPFLLEVNHSPQLGPDTVHEMANQVKSDMLHDLMELINIEGGRIQKAKEIAKYFFGYIQPFFSLKSSSYIENQRIVLTSLSEEALYLLALMELEYQDRCDWDRVFPCQDSITKFQPLIRNRHSELYAYWLHHSFYLDLLKTIVIGGYSPSASPRDSPRSCNSSSSIDLDEEWKKLEVEMQNLYQTLLQSKLETQTGKELTEWILKNYPKCEDNIDAINTVQRLLDRNYISPIIKEIDLVKGLSFFEETQNYKINPVLNQEENPETYMEWSTHGKSLYQRYIKPFSFQVKDNVIVQVEQRGVSFAEELGNTVWDGALVLAKWMVNSSKFKHWENLNVLEIGSGTGLVGIVSAKMGAKTTLTDLKTQIPLLKNNLILNHLEERKDVKVLPLHWGESTNHLEGPYDIIIAAECIYYIDVVPLLLQSLSDLANSDTQILVSFERHNENASLLFEQKASELFHIYPVPRNEQDPIYQSDKISIWILKLKSK